MRYGIAFTLVGLGLAGAAHAQTFSYAVDRRRSPTRARKKSCRLLPQGTALHAPSNIAAGDLLAFERMPGAMTAGITLSMGKARSAARFQHPTAALEQAINTTRPAAITAGMIMMQGGVPIVVNGAVIGAVGVSGFDKANDVKIADTAAKLP